MELLFEHFFHLLHLLRQNSLYVTLLVGHSRWRISSIFKFSRYSAIWLRKLSLVVLSFFDLRAAVCSGQRHCRLGRRALLGLRLLFSLLHFPNYFKMSVNTKEISVYGFLLNYKHQNVFKARLEEFCKFLNGVRSETDQDIDIFCDKNERSYWKRALVIKSEN